MAETTTATISNSLTKLGECLQSNDTELLAAIEKASQQNPWFTKKNISLSLNNIATNYLDKGKLDGFIKHYALNNLLPPKIIGLVMAGNVPLVGFHDLLCVLLSGNKAMIKLSSKDTILLPFLTNQLIKIDSSIKNKITYVEILKDFDAVIATGSNNSARYFESYFGKYPNIIRKNRTSVAVLTGEETNEELKLLANDVFSYWGLGCRNVSKFFIPKNYHFDLLLKNFEHWKSITDFGKYKNNFDYNLTLLLMNKVEHIKNDFVLLIENAELHSPISVIHYEYYDDINAIKKLLEDQKEAIQCIIGKEKDIKEIIPFGQSQHPGLFDYADNADTMQFLLTL